MRMKVKFNVAKIKLKTNSPWILVGVGVVSTIAGVIVACKETRKVDDILEDHKARLDEIHERNEVPLVNPVNEDTEVSVVDTKQIRKETTRAYIKTGADFAKLYAPAIGLVALGIGSFLTSNKILNKRYFGALALYNSEAAAFRNYRKRVIEAEGVDKDVEYRLGKAQKKTIERLTVNENGDEVKEKTQVSIIDPDGTVVGLSECAVMFGRGCDQWDPNEYYNRTFLKGQEDILNIMLHDEGVVTLNDALGAIGVQKTDAGLILGWLNDGETEVVFDIHERWVPDENGNYEPLYLIDFPELVVVANHVNDIKG